MTFFDFCNSFEQFLRINFRYRVNRCLGFWKFELKFAPLPGGLGGTAERPDLFQTWKTCWEAPTRGS